MRLFSERNPLPIAILGTVAAIAIVLGTFYSGSMPVIGGGTPYSARFQESAGLTTDSEVRVAGVKAGTVTGVELDGTSVVVSFKLDDVELPDRTTAEVRVKTLLGQKYVELQPEGEDELEPGGMIPLERTTVPFDMAEALEGLGSTVGEIDTPQLAESFEALSDAFDDTPEELGTMLEGLSSLARTVASRDTEIAELMAHTEEVTGEFAALDDELGTLLTDGDLLLTELDKRRESLKALLRGTRKLARQVTGIIRENSKELAPALKKLDRVSRILKRNEKHLDEALRLLGPYYSALTDATGAGPWLTGAICGLFDEDGRPMLDDAAVRDCKRWVN